MGSRVRSQVVIAALIFAAMTLGAAIVIMNKPFEQHVLTPWSHVADCVPACPVISETYGWHPDLAWERYVVVATGVVILMVICVEAVERRIWGE
jgi:hypothetical protein